MIRFLVLCFKSRESNLSLIQNKLYNVKVNGRSSANLSINQSLFVFVSSCSDSVTARPRAVSPVAGPSPASPSWSPPPQWTSTWNPTKPRSSCRKTWVDSLSVYLFLNHKSSDIWQVSSNIWVSCQLSK